MKILVVDDQLDILEIMSTILNNVGHEVKTATNGFFALWLLKDFAADLAIVDINLGDVSGYELADEIKNHYPKCRLIASTGYQPDFVKKYVYQNGFERCLYKPFTIKTLLTAVGDAVDGIIDVDAVEDFYDTSYRQQKPETD